MTLIQRVLVSVVLPLVLPAAQFYGGEERRVLQNLWDINSGTLFETS